MEQNAKNTLKQATETNPTEATGREKKIALVGMLKEKILKTATST